MTKHFIYVFIFYFIACERNENEVITYVDPDCFGSPGFPSTASQYASMIESELGIVPTIILDSLIEIPLYQNGTQVYGQFSSSEIDNPSYLGGKDTWSGSALQRYEGVKSDGTPLPHVVWVAFLRNTSSPSYASGSVQLIGYNEISGATAFFEGAEMVGIEVLQNYVTSIDPITLSLKGTLPGPDNPTQFNQTYIPPPAQCVQCHQSDPFITNDFINSAKIPGTNNPIIPHLNGNSPFYVIGGEDWDMRTIHIEENACFSCHRIGMGTLEVFNNDGYDVNQHMPPYNPGSLSDSYAELVNAWLNGPDNTPNAEWIVPPACEQPAQIVGNDYPYKADFNSIGSKGDDDGKNGDCEDLDSLSCTQYPEYCNWNEETNICENIFDK